MYTLLAMCAFGFVLGLAAYHRRKVRVKEHIF